MQEYGYLALRRDYGGLVTFPDGQKKYFGELSEAEKFHQKWLAENVLEKAELELEQKRRAFVDGCRVQEKRVKQPGLLTPYLVVRNIVDATGQYVGLERDGNFDSVVEEAASKQFSLPLDQLVSSGATGKVEKSVVWAAGLYLGGTFKSLPAIWRWNFGFPIEDVLKILNDLASDRWEISNVSEDRGIYKGATNQTDSAVTTVRYLLTREINAT